MSDYFDLQVNGYAGVDFNDDSLTGDQLHAACERLAQDGVTGFLATIITEQLDRMNARLARLAALRARDPLVAKLMRGVHIEGPFLSGEPGYRGAHPADAILPGDADVMRRLLDEAGGLTRLVTLAPECDPRHEVIRLLAAHGVTVAAGHTNATRDQLQAALDAGVTMFTHLGNGCPLELPRHDNIIQRVLSLADRLWVSVIADGVHVPFYVLGNFIRAIGTERCVVVTDAMAAAGCGPGRHRLGRWEIEMGEDGAAWSPDHSHLVGAATTMPQLHRNLRDQLGLSEADCQRLLAINPSRAIGITVAAGSRAPPPPGA